jgi:creatinine amidohydrolase
VTDLQIRWQDNSWPMLEAALVRDPVVVLPVGALEQHGPHLPVGVDSTSVEAVALRAAERRRGQEPPTLVLPTLFYGYSPHHMAFKGTVTLRSETFLAVVADIVESVLTHGARRVLILNGHGGNVASLEVVASRLGAAWHGRARIAAATYFHLVAGRAAEFRESAEGGMGHACEFETSMQLVLHPQLVDMTAATTCYPRLPSPRQSTDLFGSSSIRSYHDFHDLSPTGVLGDPALASAVKGEAILRACVEEVTALIEDLGRWPIG